MKTRKISSRFKVSVLKSILCSFLTVYLLVNYNSVSIFATETSGEQIEVIYRDEVIVQIDKLSVKAGVEIISKTTDYITLIDSKEEYTE